jgi:hypothetical protein
VSSFLNGIKVDSRGTRRFDREFRVSVLEFLDKDNSEDATCLQFHITKRELKRITAWKKNKNLVPYRKELVETQKTLRARLYDKAVSAVSNSLDPIEMLIEKNPVLSGKGIELLPTVVGHERNRGQNAIKVLEGLGDFRRGGDDVPREGPRQPLFNLPPGSHVAVKMEITTGGNDASSGGRTESIIEAEAVDTSL